MQEAVLRSLLLSTTGGNCFAKTLLSGGRLFRLYWKLLFSWKFLWWKNISEIKVFSLGKLEIWICCHFLYCFIWLVRHKYRENNFKSINIRNFSQSLNISKSKKNGILYWTNHGHFSVRKSNLLQSGNYKFQLFYSRFKTLLSLWAKYFIH